jgi:hypothetical protein
MKAPHKIEWSFKFVSFDYGNIILLQTAIANCQVVEAQSLLPRLLSDQTFHFVPVKMMLTYS